MITKMHVWCEFGHNKVIVVWKPEPHEHSKTFLNQFLMGSEYPERGYLLHKIIVLTITFILSLTIVNVRSKNNEPI